MSVTVSIIEDDAANRERRAVHDAHQADRGVADECVAAADALDAPRVASARDRAHHASGVHVDDGEPCVVLIDVSSNSVQALPSKPRQDAAYETFLRSIPTS